MKKQIARLKAFDSDKECVNVIVETPKGSRVKYAYEPDIGLFQLKRALPEGMVFPFNFGFVPSTQGQDGDPLDILILNEEPLLSGCLVKVRLIGIIEGEQTEKKKTFRNDRLVGLAISKQAPSDLDSIKLDKETRAHIEHFFISYNLLDSKKFKVVGTGSASKALAAVKRGIKEFQKKQKEK
jgi:inorganic pyrophosphatase